MKEWWEEERHNLEELKEKFDFLVPVELIVPSDPEDERAVAKFEMSVLEICAARNNNAPLTQEPSLIRKAFMTKFVIVWIRQLLNAWNG
jgi:hypothetical protein